MHGAYSQAADSARYTRVRPHSLFYVPLGVSLAVVLAEQF
jgi:hypothetical protein